MVLNNELMLLLIFVIFLIEKSKAAINSKPPNIVFILADDLGWADVSWNNPRWEQLFSDGYWWLHTWYRISTPNLENLSQTSTLLTSLYTLPVCTPSRAALLTGQYPFKFGLQRGYGDLSPNGLPTGIWVHLTIIWWFSFRFEITSKLLERPGLLHTHVG